MKPPWFTTWKSNWLESSYIPCACRIVCYFGQQSHDQLRDKRHLQISPIKITKCTFTYTGHTLLPVAMKTNAICHLPFKTTTRSTTFTATSQQTALLSLFNSNISTATHAPCIIQKEEGWGWERSDTCGEVWGKLYYSAAADIVAFCTARERNPRSYFV